MDQTRHKTETWDREYVDSKMIKLLFRVCALCEDEQHVIMDCPFVPFDIKVCIVRHVELHNMVGVVIDKPHE